MRTVWVCAVVLALVAGCKKDPQGGVSELDSRPLGASAHELLSADNYTSLVVEVAYVKGYQPQPSSLTNLKTFLESRLNKPGGIELILQEIPSPGKDPLSLDDIVKLEKQHRGIFTQGSQISVCLLVTDGGYEEDNADSRVLGLAYGNTSLVLFGKNILENSGSIGKPSRMKLETTVMEHESGHIMGLVDLGTPMQAQHQDVSHGKHCINQGCLMYYSANSTDFMGFLMNNNVPPLDQNCLNDLKANGGK